jgi:RNA 2',3'-cyclic 3'-phosphodiesterase
MDGEAVRAFIAIDLPEEIRHALNTVEQQIQARGGEPARKAIRWVSAGNMHLTLKFLGEVSTSNLQSLSQKLKEEANRHAALTFTVSGLGAFPNVRRPRVLWVGVQAPPGLLALQKSIETGAQRLGYQSEERPFSPHLTLGRTVQNARPEEVTALARALSEVEVGELGQVRVDHICLYRSDLRPSGAVYTLLQAFPLRGQG